MVKAKTKIPSMKAIGGKQLGRDGFPMTSVFIIKASPAGKGDKWKNVGEDEDDAIDIFLNRLEIF